MSSHVRANLWLLLFSIVLSSIAYPLVVLGFGQGLFPHKADGSLLYDKAGNVIGSALIAQPFSETSIFIHAPRPSRITPHRRPEAIGARTTICCATVRPESSDRS